MALASSNDVIQQGDSHKKIVITGVSQGLGRALALELANRGHTIVGCSRNKTKLDSLHQELLKTSSSDHLLFNIDVQSNGCIEEMARSCKEKIGPPDIIVNNAAVIHDNSKMWEVPKQDFDYVIDVNIKGIANVMRHFIPLMIPNNQGVVVNMSSIYGRSGARLASAYNASKWAIEGLSKCVAQEVPDGMAIVALDPGIINTEMLVTLFGNLASQYQSPDQQWALKAASMILNFNSADNGTSPTVDDPGVLPY